jgi:hypothetical protein
MRVLPILDGDSQRRRSLPRLHGERRLEVSAAGGREEPASPRWMDLLILFWRRGVWVLESVSKVASKCLPKRHLRPKTRYTGDPKGLPADEGASPINESMLPCRSLRGRILSEASAPCGSIKPMPRARLLATPPRSCRFLTPESSRLLLSRRCF